MRRQDSARLIRLCLLLTLLLAAGTVYAEPQESSKRVALENPESEPPEGLVHRPTIAVRYGTASIDRDGFESQFANAGLLGLQIGFRSQTRYEERNDIVEHRFGGLFAQHLSTKISVEDPGASELTTDLWRFGVVESDGHGYRLNARGATISPYHESSIGWSFFDLRDESAPPVNGADSSMVETLEDRVRFGVLWQGGVRLSPSDRVGLDIGYERSLVFPWTKVWYTLLSMGIEEFALGATDKFIEEIAKTSPGAVPVVEFILKSGLSYGLFELRQEKMNWPFNSAAPLAYDTFKIGLTTTF